MNELRMQYRKYMQGRIRSLDLRLTYEMLEVMICLWRQDGVNQQLIADITLRDKSAMTYLVDNLIKRKMITRKEDDRDRRNKLIYLTQEGRQLQETLQPWLAEMYDKATAQVDTAALVAGKALIEGMIKNLLI
ncbi:MAG TPA: MarR family transcriptional regulator [Puia sp.]|jgi:DNA-binding MarR family transcriptional regulator|nr:MarR family transcriptional regulator [Puia sp.]